MLDDGLTLPRTASGQNAPFQVQQNPNVAAMRWRGGLGGFTPRRFPHFLSRLVVFLWGRPSLRAPVLSLDPLVLFLLLRLSLRALNPRGCGEA